MGYGHRTPDPAHTLTIPFDALEDGFPHVHPDHQQRSRPQPCFQLHPRHLIHYCELGRLPTALCIQRNRLTTDYLGNSNCCPEQGLNQINQDFSIPLFDTTLPYHSKINQDLAKCRSDTGKCRTLGSIPHIVF